MSLDPEAESSVVIPEFGFDLVTRDSLSLSELKKIIEEELFELSEAHYQRYFKVEKYLNV